MSFKKSLVAAGLLAASTVATAAPITGEIGFAGTVVNDGSSITFTSASVNAGTGTYAGLVGTTASISDIVYMPFYSTTNPLWTVTSGPSSFSFDLSTLSQSTVGPFFLLQGTGTLYATGYDATPGTWLYSDQGAGTLTFSAQSAPVSEPATIALLGLGLAGLGFARRKQAKAA